MAEKLGQIIKQIIEIDGEEIFCSAKRFNALLDDLAPELTTERKVFHRAVSDEVLLIFSKIKEHGTSIDEFELLKVKNKLEEDYGLSESWSILIISSFADAFEIHHNLSLKPQEQAHDEAPSSRVDSSDVLSSEELRRSNLIKEKELLLKEKASLGLFSVKRRAELEKKIADIDLKLAVEGADKTIKKVEEKKVSETPQNRNFFKLTGIQTYSSDGTSYGPKMWSASFLTGETKYIGIKVLFDVADFDRVANLTWRIYNENGTPFTNNITLSLTAQPTHESVFQQWGWQETGNWPAGRYKIVASINGSAPIQTWIEIKNGRYDTLPSPIRNVKLFNCGDQVPPIQQREFTNIFYKSSARRIYFQLEFAQPGRDLSTTFEIIIKDSAGNYVTNLVAPTKINSNYAVYWNGYGWATPGNWTPGIYTYSVALGKSKPVTGTFEIKP